MLYKSQMLCAKLAQIGNLQLISQRSYQACMRQQLAQLQKPYDGMDQLFYCLLPRHQFELPNDLFFEKS